MTTITNIDVTLRDGGYRNGFNFTRSYALRHAELTIAAGFNWVEIAYLKGSFKPETSTGLTGRGDNDYITSVAERVGAEHVALIGHPRNITPNDLSDAYAAGARLIRLCANSSDPTPTWPLLEHARALGFSCAVNLTRVSNLSAHAIATLSRAAAEHGAHAIYLADSNGALYPTDVTRAVTIAADVSDLEVGLHAHNNLGLALANALAATSAGARWIDSSVLGMGKGAGNLIAEQWITYLDRNHDPAQFDLAAIIDLSRSLAAEVPESAPVVPAIDLLLGRYNLSVEHHSSLSRATSRDSVLVARNLALSA